MATIVLSTSPGEEEVRFAEPAAEGSSHVNISALHGGQKLPPWNESCDYLFRSRVSSRRESLRAHEFRLDQRHFVPTFLTDNPRSSPFEDIRS